MNRQPILQQYYTRGRQGVFRSNEGYDTVARTPGLDNQFIKKTLHPFCVYDAPRQLQERGEGELSSYPEALVCFHAESGEMVLGRSVFVGADFTGQRNTFFSHNYVIPAARRDEFIAKPEKVFGVRSFASSHDDAHGKDLPAVDDLPGQPDLTVDRKRLLGQLGIDERLFKQLLYAVMTSLTAKKKVFISLDVDISEAATRASQLLEVLYNCLPYELRRHFGFLTYSSEPQSKKHIHVMFVEKGSIRPGGGHSDKDFLFDLALGRVQNVDLQDGGHEYLDFAWENVKEPQDLAQFHSFCEEVLAGADQSLALQLRTYYELCALYLIEKGRTAVYEKNRAGVWQALVSYLRHPGLAKNKRLHDLQLLLFRIEVEALAEKKLPDGETIRQMIESSDASKQDRLRVDMVRYLLNVLMRAQAAGQRGLLSDVFKHLAASPELFGMTMKTIFQSEPLIKSLFERYFSERLAAVTTMDGMLGEIRFWAQMAPEAMRHAFFAAETTEKLLRLFAREKSKLDTAIAIHQFFDNLDGARNLADSLLDELDKSLLKLIDLEKLSRDDFQKMIALLEEKPQSFFGTLDVASRQKQEMLMNVAQLRETKGVLHPTEFFRKWEREEVRIQQRIIQNMLASPLDTEDFAHVPLVFYHEDRFGQDGFQFTEMLDFVQKHGGEETLFSFVQWTLAQRLFFEGKQLLPAYRLALRQLFLENKAERLRNKEWRKRWSALRHADFRKLLEEVRSETANPLAKLFRHKKLMLSAVVVLMGAGAVAGYMLSQQKPLTEPELPQEKPVTEQPVPDVVQAEYVPAYRLMLEEPHIQPVRQKTAENGTQDLESTDKPTAP
ncbi:hypothetical protein [Brevibacillus parabrevis]|uniref:Glycosyltransferase n=1 Tax=Brevibacillus parabrevis TaxID=54914 RepID=A0A4Y3PJS2_BREPA|nr:hypothetical protein [Brevibacillus parabrevis]RNB97060.1 hypothetical protein EDM60_01695 [Brevibacillus parabrevis]GEB33663.1 hypothetical protein BPA01_32430 [Brevibacillus parabrevis]